MSKNISENHVSILNVEVEIEAKQVFRKRLYFSMQSVSEEPQILRILFIKKEILLENTQRRQKKRKRLHYRQRV